MAGGLWYERFWLRPIALYGLNGAETAVVDFAALRIGENLIGLDDVLKGGCTLWPYPIGVILLGQGAERALDTPSCRGRGYSQNDVVVLLCHDRTSSALLPACFSGE